MLLADLSDMGAPGARMRTLVAIAEAFIRQPELFQRSGSVEEIAHPACCPLDKTTKVGGLSKYSNSLLKFPFDIPLHGIMENDA